MRNEGLRLALFVSRLFWSKELLTYVFDESEHDPADVQVALDSDQPFRLQFRDVDPQIPRAVADNLPVGHHLDFRTSSHTQQKH